MAETKTRKRAAPKRAQSSKRTRSSKRRTTKAKASARSRTQPRAAGPANGGNQVEAVRNAVEDKAKDAGRAVSDATSKAGDVAGKAKIPLLAGGVALAGAASGFAIAAATRQSGHHNGLAKAMRKPRIKLDADDVARAAKGVGRFSAQVGELASGVQRATEATNGDGHHRRSPVEVVLQGLTARR